MFHWEIKSPYFCVKQSINTFLKSIPPLYKLSYKQDHNINIYIYTPHLHKWHISLIFHTNTYQTQVTVLHCVPQVQTSLILHHFNSIISLLCYFNTFIASFTSCLSVPTFIVAPYTEKAVFYYLNSVKLMETIIDLMSSRVFRVWYDEVIDDDTVCVCVLCTLL